MRKLIWLLIVSAAFAQGPGPAAGDMFGDGPPQPTTAQIVGTRWIDQTAKQLYICTNLTYANKVYSCTWTNVGQASLASPGPIGATTPSTGNFIGVSTNGVIDCATYTSLSHATKLQTCINDAITQNKIADARGFGSDTFSSQINFGDSSGDPVAVLLPSQADWKTSVSDGVSCGFKQFRNAILIGPSSAYNFMLMESSNVSTNVAYVFCDDNVDGTYQASGFQIKNTAATTASGFGAIFRNWTDNSYLRNVQIFDYVNKGVDFTRLCCGVIIENLNVFGNNTSDDLIHIDSNGNSNAINFINLSAGHAASGKKHIAIAESNLSTPSLTVNFLGQLYMEHTNADTTTSCITISGGVAYHFGNVQCGNNSGDTQATIEILNVTPAPIVQVDSIRFNFGSVSFPAVVVKNDITGLNYSTDANGFFGGYNSGTSASNGNLSSYLNLIENSSALSGVAGQDLCRGDSTAHALKCNFNNGGEVALPLLSTANTWTGTNDYSTGKYRNYPCAPQFSSSDTLSNATLTTEQFFATNCAIPANSFVANKALRVWIGTDVVSTASPNFTFKVYVCTVQGCGSGTNKLLYSGTSGAPSASMLSGGIELIIQGEAAAGASTSIATASIAGAAANLFGLNKVTSHTSGVPTNGILYLSTSITFSTTTGTNNMTLTQLVTEWIN